MPRDFETLLNGPEASIDEFEFERPELSAGVFESEIAHDEGHDHSTRFGTGEAEEPFLSTLGERITSSLASGSVAIGAGSTNDGADGHLITQIVTNRTEGDVLRSAQQLVAESGLQASSSHGRYQLVQGGGIIQGQVTFASFQQSETIESDGDRVSEFIPFNPQQPSMVVDLAALGLADGDTISIETVGDFSASGNPSDPFSADAFQNLIFSYGGFSFYNSAEFVLNSGLTLLIENGDTPLGDNTDPDGDYGVLITSSSCEPLDPWILTPISGEFASVEGEGICRVDSGVTGGRSDGLSSLFRITGSSTTIGDGLITISGAVFYSEIGNIPASLFQAPSLVFDESSLTADLSDAALGNFRMAGLQIEFDGMAINPNSLAFDAQITMPIELGGLVYNTVELGDRVLIIDESGPQIRSDVTVQFPDFPDINFFGLTTVDLTDLSLEYRALNDEFYLRGKIGISNFADGYEGSFTLDLSGDENFLRVYENNGSPTVSVNGELKAIDVLDIRGWKLERLELFLREDTQRFGGTVEIESPFGVRFGTGIAATVGVEFAYDPFALDAAEVKIDNLNKPIPAYPYLFLQSVGAALKNLAPGSADATVLEGSFGITLLPQFSGGTSLARGDWTVSVSSEEIVGALDLDILTASFSYDGRDLGILTLIEANGQATLNWNDGFLSYDSSFNILDIIQGNGSLKFDRDLNFNLSSTTSLVIPERMSSTFGGQTLGNAELRIAFSNDGNLGNDYVAAWQTLNLNPLGVGPEINAVFGVRIGFDGTVSLINSENQPEVGSWDVAEGLEYVILTAVWENAVSEVVVSVIEPDGTVIEEAEFEAAGIAVIEDLSSPTQRSVYIATPEAGVWDIAITSPEDTGEVTGEAIGPSGGTPEVALTAPLTVSGGVVSIAYEAFDADSNATISFWYDDDLTDLNGGYIGEAEELDGAAIFEWNSVGILPGTYYVYAVIDDGTTIPMTAVSENAVSVGSSSDLAIAASLPEEVVAAGEEVTFSVTVTNLSANDVTGVTTFLDLPAGAEVVATSLEGTGTELDLGDLAAGAELSFEVTLIAPATATEGSRSIGLTVSSDHHDADLSNNTATVVLDVLAAETTDLDGAGSSEILIGTEASERISSFDGGFDIFAGSAGADIFVFSADTEDGLLDRLMISDYEVGTDAIDLGDAQLFAVVEEAEDLVLQLGPDGEDEIVIVGVQSYEQLTLI